VRKRSTVWFVREFVVKVLFWRHIIISCTAVSNRWEIGFTTVRDIWTVSRTKICKNGDLCFLPHEKFIAWSCLNRNGRIADLGNVMRERTKGIFETATVFWRSNRLVSFTRSDSFTYLKALTRARCGSRNVECRPPKKMDPALQLSRRFKLLFFPLLSLIYTHRCSSCLSLN